MMPNKNVYKAKRHKEDFIAPEKLRLYGMYFVCFVCENEWYTSVPPGTNIIMTCPKCWNPAGMREDIIYRGFDTEH